MHGNRLFVGTILFLVASAVEQSGGYAQSSQLGKKVGQILFSGNVSDDDARDLRNIIYREMEVTDQVTKECDSFVATSTRMLISIGKGDDGAYSMNKIVEGAERCANSGPKKSRKDSKRRLPPLPKFNSAAWRNKRQYFDDSYYAVKSMRSPRGEHLGWSQAQSACWKDHRGRLVTIESEEEDRLVAELVNKHGSAYIGILMKWRMGGEAPPQWVRHTASGKDGPVKPYQNWLDGEPSRSLDKVRTFNVLHGYWGVYDRARPPFWKLWKSSDETGWKTVHPGALIGFPVSVGICEWDKREWLGISDVHQLSRNRLFSRNGGVVEIDGERYRF